MLSVRTDDIEVEINLIVQLFEALFEIDRKHYEFVLLEATAQSIKNEEGNEQETEERHKFFRQDCCSMASSENCQRLYQQCKSTSRNLLLALVIV